MRVLGGCRLRGGGLVRVLDGWTGIRGLERVGGLGAQDCIGEVQLILENDIRLEECYLE